MQIVNEKGERLYFTEEQRKALLSCTDRIDRLHLFGYIVYRCATLLVVVVKYVKGFGDDPARGARNYDTVQDPSRHKRPPPPLSLRSGGPLHLFRLALELCRSFGMK